VDEIAPTAMAGAVSALFLLDIKGRVLVWRDYRGDVSALQAERFFTKLLDKEVSDRSAPPGPHLLSAPEICSVVVLSSCGMGRTTRKCTRRWSTTTPASRTCSSSTTTSSSSPQPARIATRPAFSSSFTASWMCVPLPPCLLRYGDDIVAPGLFMRHVRERRCSSTTSRSWRRSRSEITLSSW